MDKTKKRLIDSLQKEFNVRLKIAKQCNTDGHKLAEQFEIGFMTGLQVAMRKLRYSKLVSQSK